MWLHTNASLVCKPVSVFPGAVRPIIVFYHSGFWPSCQVEERWTGWFEFCVRWCPI